MKVEKLSVFGLGKLGATMVGCFASRGFTVVGVDVNRRNVELVQKGQAPVPEPGLQDLYDGSRTRIRATMDPADAVAETDVSFIIVPTPSTPQGEFFTSIACKAAEGIGAALRKKSGYHLVVLTSTVLPGATERDIRATLESASGKRCGPDFGLCYSPEFIAIGDVVNGLLKPDFFLVGESDKRSGDLLESIYRRLQVVADNDKKQAIPIARMSIANAELTKISVNAFVTAKISFANTLCRICDAMPDGDSHVVAKAVGMDQRIGGRYLAPGATYGGPCFPRDNRAFEWFARSVGADAPLARATDEVNRQQVDFLVRLIVAKAPTGTTVGLLGLSYKPHTNLMEESLAVELAERLIGRGYRVVAYDPWVAKHGVTETVPGLQILVSMELCMRESRVLVLCTAHEEFLNLKRADLGDGVMVDIWGALRRRGWTVDRRYVVPGVSESTAVSG